MLAEYNTECSDWLEVERDSFLALHVINVNTYCQVKLTIFVYCMCPFISLMIGISRAASHQFTSGICSMALRGSYSSRRPETDQRKSKDVGIPFM